MGEEHLLLFLCIPIRAREWECRGKGSGGAGGDEAITPRVLQVVNAGEERGRESSGQSSLLVIQRK
jgi:hypothetical protein